MSLIYLISLLVLLHFPFKVNTIMLLYFAKRCGLYALAVSVLSLFSPAAFASTSNPAIDGITLGMSLPAAAAILKQIAGSQGVVQTLYGNKADGSGRYVRAFALKLETGEPGYTDWPAGQQIAVVFTEDNEQVASVMRDVEFAGSALPGVSVINKNLQKTYGIELSPYSPPFSGRTDLAATKLEDAAGQPTNDKRCLSTTLGLSAGGLAILSKMQDWTDFFSGCGRLFRVTIYLADDPHIAYEMQQQMADTQAIFRNVDYQNKARQQAATAQAKAAEDKANQQTAPQL